MAPRHFAFVLFCTLAWGFNFIAAKVALEQLPAIFFSGLRFIVVMLLLFPWAKPVHGQWRRVFWVAQTSGGIGFALAFFALSIADNIATVAIPLQLGVPFSVVLAALILREAVGLRRAAGVLLAFAGIVIISYEPQVFARIGAVLIATGSALSYAIATLLLRRLEGIGVFQLQFWIAVFSAPLIMILSVFVEEGQITQFVEADWKVYGAVALTAISGSIIGHGGIYYMLQRYEVSKVMPVTVLAPIWGVLFGVLLLGDVLSWEIVIGSLTTLSGVVIVQFRRSARRGVTAEDAV